jgi:hypothetical protein
VVLLSGAIRCHRYKRLVYMIVPHESDCGPFLPPDAQARLGVLQSWGTAPTNPCLLAVEFLLVDGGAR